jgi:hypothetical protein
MLLICKTISSVSPKSLFAPSAGPDFGITSSKNIRMISWGKLQNPHHPNFFDYSEQTGRSQEFSGFWGFTARIEFRKKRIQKKAFSPPVGGRGLG